ncbi:MAG: DUF2096 family protein [Candidatus Bathyarchaeia archaeon]
MGYLTVWKVLEEMITDFRRRGVAVPKEVIGDLKYARTLINVLKADPSSLETSQRIEEYLNNIESYLVSNGLEKFGDKYVEEWLKRLDEASKKVFDDEEKEIRFIPGVPRDQRWIRIRPTEDMPIEALKALAEELNLSINVQKDGCLLVYGDEGVMKDFVKKMATKYGLKARK